MSCHHALSCVVKQRPTSKQAAALAAAPAHTTYSHGPNHNKIEALVAAVRKATMRLRAISTEHYLFAGCHTIEKLVKKLKTAAQTHRFYYQAKHQQQSKWEAFESWLQIEGTFAVKHRQHIIATSFMPNRKQQRRRHCSTRGIKAGILQRRVSDGSREQHQSTPRTQLWCQGKHGRKKMSGMQRPAYAHKCGRGCHNVHTA